ncbi:MAG: DMT family transporter [Bryobacteraceae bacterium]
MPNVCGRLVGTMKSSRALLWVAFGSALWGTDTLFRRPLTAVLETPRIVLYEHLILTVVLLPVCWRGRAQWMTLAAREWAAVVAISWGGSALGTLCFTEAVRIGNPTTAILLQKIQPVFAALLAWALLGESLGRRFWMWLALAAACGWLVSFGFGWPVGGEGKASAAALAAIAAGLWGISTVLGRYLLRFVAFDTLTGLRIVTAVPLLLALAKGSERGELGLRTAGSLAALALIPGLLALLMYYKGLTGARASRAAIAELTFPAMATLLNYVFLGAGITWSQAAGFVLLCAVILQLEKERRPAAPPGAK